MEEKVLKKYIISKEDMKEIFNNRKVISKEEYIKYKKRKLVALKLH